MNLSDIRKEYTLKTLSKSTVSANPVEQFTRWFEEAIDSSVNEPNAMHLSTVDADNHPNGRIVLLKSCNEEGFTFFTNYQSDKGRELSQNPSASLTFFWPELERQVRVRGSVALLSPEESDRYFQSRPRASQVGAWVSAQSQVIAGRHLLEDAQTQLEKEFGDREITRPPHWGGFCLVPTRVEFWQGRASRLHDRICYSRQGGAAAWTIDRLSP
jgi:pyridoxamine 5'-phosphate oxidase